MMIRTNALRGLVEAAVDGIPVTDRWDEIRSILTERCQDDVAALFARPSITRSNGASESIARWHSDIEGTAVSLSAIDPAAQGAITTNLAALLSRLEPLLSDPATSRLIGSCLYIPSMADVMVVGGRPVIVNWGFLAEDKAAATNRREAHFRSTLGQFLPALAVPAFGGDGPETAAAPQARLAAAPPVAAEAGAAASADEVPLSSGAVPPSDGRLHVVHVEEGRPWLPAAVATGVALVVLLVLLIPGILIYPDSGMAAAPDRSVRDQINGSLEEYVDQLRRQLAEAKCTPSAPTGSAPKAVPGQTPAGRLPAGTTGEAPRGGPGAAPTGPASPPATREATARPPAAVPSASPPQTPTPTPAATEGRPPPAGSSQPLPSNQLLATLENATVLVLVLGPAQRGGGGTGVQGFGSGFFINDKQIVTNRHVVESAGPDRVFVANKALTHPVKARVVTMSPNSELGRDDFALLEIDEAANVTALPLGAEAERLNPVTAAGFTGTLVRDDQAFGRLLNGDSTAMPEMIVSQGIITVVHRGASGTVSVYHTATISNGNSGGPLSDACGRVVAVNTFGRTDPNNPIVFNGALSTATLLPFLEKAQAKVTKATTACGGGAAATPATPAAGGGDTPPATPAPASGGAERK
jgi:S1-C subfamily serine protease